MNYQQIEKLMGFGYINYFFNDKIVCTAYTKLSCICTENGWFTYEYYNDIPLILLEQKIVDNLENLFY